MTQVRVPGYSDERHLSWARLNRMSAAREAQTLLPSAGLSSTDARLGVGRPPTAQSLRPATLTSREPQQSRLLPRATLVGRR